MDEAAPTETSPMLMRNAPTRASYAHGDVLVSDRVSYRSTSSDMRRARSMPVFTRRDLRTLSLSTFYYEKFYMAEGGSFISSAFNLASATCGAGVLALPHAMRHTGTVLGVFTLVVVCTLTVYSVFVLTKVSTIVELTTYEELAADLIGPGTARVTNVLLVIFCWGVAVMYVVVMGDFVSPFLTILHVPAYVGRRTAMIFFWAFIMLPLSLARKINTLRYASAVGTISTLLLAVALGMQFMKGTGGDAAALVEETHRIPLFNWDEESIGGLSTFVFSFCCQPVVLKVFEEMQYGTPNRMLRCATYSMGICTLVYIFTGLFGCWSFGSETNANVLVNFSKHLDAAYVQLAYVGMAVAVTMAFPMTIFPTRDSVVMAMGYHPEENPVPGWLSSTVAGVLAALALVFGLLVPNIRVLFDVLGGICGGSLSFLLPGMFALSCGAWTIREMGLAHVVSAWLLVIVGLLMCVLGTYSSLRANFF